MSFLTKLQDQAKQLTTKAKKLLPTSHITTKIDVPHRIALNSTEVTGSLDITAHHDIYIQTLTYTIKELQDPLIGKDTQDLEVIHTSNYKKKFKLKKDDSKTISLTLPIEFNPTTSDIGAGDMSLMNKMSERSKLTAINFSLQIIATYTLPESGDSKKEHTLKWKHDISFE